MTGWNLTDLEPAGVDAPKVMSTFSCGGGSSMGYKLAGCDVIAANDIDPQMQWHYLRNLHPENYFLCPIRDLLTMELPPALFDLDIFDGSPPCSTFSMSGNREKDWGKDKHFREGQQSQILDDLFFDFLDVAERLNPKVIVAENVKGMLVGNARGYTSAIMDRLKGMGYRPQLFLLNAAEFGVPQLRERVFFCAVREDVSDRKLSIEPSTPVPITAAEALDGVEQGVKSCGGGARTDVLWPHAEVGDTFVRAARKMYGMKASYFNCSKADPNQPARTVAAENRMYHWAECRTFNYRELSRFQTFPDDYEVQTNKLGDYLIGMSVPPFLTRAVALSIREQWLS